MAPNRPSPYTLLRQGLEFWVGVAEPLSPGAPDWAGRRSAWSLADLLINGAAGVQDSLHHPLQPGHTFH